MQMRVCPPLCMCILATLIILCSLSLSLSLPSHVQYAHTVIISLQSQVAPDSSSCWPVFNHVTTRPGHIFRYYFMYVLIYYIYIRVYYFIIFYVFITTQFGADDDSLENVYNLFAHADSKLTISVWHN